MERTQSPRIEITERDAHHEKLMRSILSNLSDTPLVLKGGTALYLGYGLNRFSEDLDFDSSKKLNILNKIKSSAPHGITITDINVKKDTDTVSRYMVNYKVNETGHSDKLKLEISYRTPAPNEETNIVNGIKVASVERLIDNKLNAAFDGENTRTKGRDLFDLHFLANHYPDHFDENSANRLKEFANDPDRLFSQYQFEFKSDPLLGKKVDLETLVLDLHERANKLVEQHNNSFSQHLMSHPSLTALTQKVDFSRFIAEDKKETDNKLNNSNQLKFKP